MKKSSKYISQIIEKLYDTRNELREKFPQFKFTLDGNLIGDIGEAIAIEKFNLMKLPVGTKTHDCKAEDGKLIQIKATQQKEKGGRVGLGRYEPKFDNLIVIQINENGMYEIIYNGLGKPITDKFKNLPLKQNYSISVKQLKELNAEIEIQDRITKK